MAYDKNYKSSARRDRQHPQRHEQLAGVVLDTGQLLVPLRMLAIAPVADSGFLVVCQRADTPRPMTKVVVITAREAIVLGPGPGGLPLSREVRSQVGDMKPVLRHVNNEFLLPPATLVYVCTQTSRATRHRAPTVQSPKDASG